MGHLSGSCKEPLGRVGDKLQEDARLWPDQSRGAVHEELELELIASVGDRVADARRFARLLVRSLSGLPFPSLQWLAPGVDQADRQQPAVAAELREDGRQLFGRQCIRHAPKRSGD